MTTETPTIEIPNVITATVAKGIVADIILSNAQELFNVIFRHVPQCDHKSAALINLELVASLIKKALDITDESVVPTDVVNPA